MTRIAEEELPRPGGANAHPPWSGDRRGAVAEAGWSERSPAVARNIADEELTRQGGANAPPAVAKMAVGGVGGSGPRSPAYSTVPAASRAARPMPMRRAMLTR
jgi:hypothetical protein